MKNLLRAAVVGVVGFCVMDSFAPHFAYAETLRIVKNGGTTDLNVPMNRAVVVESDKAFAELSIANPNIADFSTLSDRTIYVLGKTPGTTTLTLLDAQGQLFPMSKSE